MKTSERLNRLDFEIYEVVNKNVSLSMEMSPPTDRIIGRKYNAHIKSRI
jgi:hypothetical protein